MKTHLIYFSPTGTSKTTAEKIAEGTGGPVEVYDLTHAKSGVQEHISDGVAVFAMPVYAGRLPDACIERMKGITGDVPAAVVCVYGNRDYEDALVELRDAVSEKGFNVIAGGAFIGEHSYSTDEKPIAKNRPDAADGEKAADFGRAVAEKISSGGLTTPYMKGNVPYKEGMGARSITPQTDAELCEACGTCVTVCPTDVISLSDIAVSDPDGCIMCCACIKVCPSKARYVDNPAMLEKVDMLYKNFSARKEPDIFI